MIALNNADSVQPIEFEGLQKSPVFSRNSQNFPVLDDAGKAFPPQANRHLSRELLSSSVLAASVLTRIKSVHNPAGDVLDLLNQGRGGRVARTH